jgi:general secretion pathway protein G
MFMWRWFSNGFTSVFQKRKRCSHGFTLVELIVVIGVVAVLVTIGIQVYGRFIDRARNTHAIAEIRALEKEITLYINDEEKLPDTLAEVGSGVITDPWKNQYQYINFETTPKAGQKKRKNANKPLNTDYDLYSSGKDGLSDNSITEDISKDDIVRAGDGTYVGLASGYR